MQALREGPLKITKATVEAAWRRREPNLRLVVADLECRGLVLVVNPTGMTWRFDYKPRGLDAVTGKRFASQSVSIGTPASHSPDDARQAAGALKGAVKAGDDPAAARKKKIAVNAEQRSRTMARLIEDYAKALPKRARLRGKGKVGATYAADEISRVKNAVKNMKAGGKSVADIGKADLQALLRATADQPGAARHRFGAISRFFDWCQDEGMVALNPCTLIGKGRRPKPVAARQMFLKVPALATLWNAAGSAEGLEQVHRDFMRFLIAIPCRRIEAAEVRWEHLDLDAAEWTQPNTATKNGEQHRFHLHPLAMDILRERHEAAGTPRAGLVFPAPRSGKALTTFGAIKRAVVAAGGMDKADRFHDFRRSFATALGEQGFHEAVLDAVLNHKQTATRGGVLGVYQTSTRRPEQVAALNAWGEALAAAIEGRTPSRANVVPLRAAG